MELASPQTIRFGAQEPFYGTKRALKRKVNDNQNAFIIGQIYFLNILQANMF